MVMTPIYHPSQSLHNTSQSLNLAEQKSPPTYLKDYIFNSFIDAPNSSSSGTTYPFSHCMSYSHISPVNSNYVMSFNTLIEQK